MCRKDKIKKEDVENLLGCCITNTQFAEALEYAVRKQESLYKRKKSPEVLQREYLIKLTEEAVTSLTLSRFTMELYRNLRNMEKEHLARSSGAQSKQLYCKRSGKENQVKNYGMEVKYV